MSDEQEFGKLPNMTWDQVKARAQAILDVRGRPPYTVDTDITGTEEEMEKWQAAELAIITEFVTFWLPHLVEKEKPK